MNFRASSRICHSYDIWLSLTAFVRESIGGLENAPHLFIIEEFMNQYITYTCKNCGTQYRILTQWGDLKPKRCVGKRCNMNFAKNPANLEIKIPKKPSSPKKEATKAAPKTQKYQNNKKKHRNK